MAELLYRLGKGSSRRPWLVIVAWATVTVWAAVAFVVGQGPLAPGFSIPGTETDRVTRVLQEKLPALSGGAGMVVFRTDDGSPIDQRQKATITQLGAQANDLPYVALVVDPFVMLSADGSTAVANVIFTVNRLDLPDPAKIAIRDHFMQAQIDGIVVDVSAEISQTLPDIVTPAELAGVVIAAVVLVIMLGTFVAAGMPVLNALLGLGVGALIALAFSSTVQMASVTPVLGVMLGLAVGIDYALFIINRHRGQLARGAQLHESIGLANGTAGNAVGFAGSTVLVALLALNVTGIPFLGVMGNVGALCVAVAVLMAVTLTPALLGLAGHRVLRRREPRALTRPPGPAPREAGAAAPMSTRRAVAGVLMGAAVLAAVAYPALSMRLGLPDGSYESPDSTPYRTYHAVAQAFGEGVNGPLLVTATLPSPARTDTAVLQTQEQIAALVAAQPDVVRVVPVGVSADRTFFAFQVVPSEGPTSVSTADLVHRLRALSPLPDGTALGVAGQATGNIDISQQLADVLPTYLLLIAGISALIMMVVFRSVLVPIIATAGFVLSLLATLGALVAVYQWGWLGEIFGAHTAGPVLNFLPLLLCGVLFGLAMDYQLFLASGMREAYAHGLPARAAVTAGLRAGRSVVVAAGLIMVAVFSGFVLSDVTAIRPLGFGLAVGVLADAFVVRMLIMPGVLHLLGPAAWWLPRWLRWLPRVDIEGSALRRHHGDTHDEHGTAGPQARQPALAGSPEHHG